MRLGATLQCGGSLALLCSVASAYAFNQPADDDLTRDGQYYVETFAGTAQLPPSGAVKIVSRGAIVVRGQQTNGIAYVVRKRVRAKDAQEAEKFLHAAKLQVRQVGATLLFEMAGGPNSPVTPDLEIQTPYWTKQLTLLTHGGTVEAYDIAGSVQAESGGGRIQMDRIGAGVSARTAGGEMILGDIRGVINGVSGGGLIRVYRAGADAFFETAGGDIRVDSIAGPLKAATAGGNIRVGRAGAAVTARTAGGRISVMYAGGPVTAENSSGLIEVGAAKDVRCDTLVGAVRVKGIKGSIQVQTGTGNILADLAGSLLSQDSFLATNQGDITVFVPSNLAVTIRAQNTFGGAAKIISDFPEIQAIATDVRPARAEGVLNGGGPVLQLTATAGTIYLRRQR